MLAEPEARLAYPRLDPSTADTSAVDLGMAAKLGKNNPQNNPQENSDIMSHEIM